MFSLDDDAKVRKLSRFPFSTFLKLFLFCFANERERVDKLATSSPSGAVFIVDVDVAPLERCGEHPDAYFLKKKFLNEILVMSTSKISKTDYFSEHYEVFKGVFFGPTSLKNSPYK